jgi:hypothetical protein
MRRRWVSIGACWSRRLPSGFFHHARSHSAALSHFDSRRTILRFPRTLITIAVATAIVVPANAAMARGFSPARARIFSPAGQSYTGNWPVTVTHSRGANGTGCLTLMDNGSLGWPHSGQASLVFNGVKFTFGTFQLIDGDLVTTIQSQGASGQNEGLVFAASAANGNIGKGFYDGVYGGEEIDSGVLVFGMKGGC